MFGVPKNCVSISTSATGIASRVLITKKKYEKHELLGLQTDKNHAQLFNA